VTKNGGKVVRFETYLDSEPEKFVPTIDCMIFTFHCTYIKWAYSTDYKLY